MTRPEVGVVIVTYRSAVDIDACLLSVARETRTSHAVVVVDNASDDGTADLVATRHPAVTLLRNDTNLGFARAVNQGVAALESRYVLMLNPDTELLGPSIDLLVDAASRAPQHLIYGGRHISPDGEPDPRAAWGLPSLWSLLMFSVGLSTVAKSNPVLDPESLGRWKRDTEREVPAVSGCFQLVDRQLWTDLDGLDERFFLYGEDADWALRARAAGARPLLVPTAEIRHALGASSTPSKKRVSVMRGKATFIALHWRFPAVGIALLQLGAFLRGPLGNTLRRALRHPPDPSWSETWRCRREWRRGWVAGPDR